MDYLPDELKPTLEGLLGSIIRVNRVWKLIQTRRGGEDPIATTLRKTKSMLQLRLLRSFPDVAGLIDATDQAEQTEEQWSIILESPIRLRTGEIRRDAAHLPKRIAQRMASREEITRWTRKPTRQGEEVAE